MGTQMPLLEVAQAAHAHHADIVALSFSAAFPSRQIPALLQQLRGVLGRTVELWAGGGGVRRTAPQNGVRLVASLSDVVVALAEWRGAQDGSRGAAAAGAGQRAGSLGVESSTPQARIQVSPARK
jgi:hypothetical protein